MDLTVIGHIPSYAAGVLYRNGPGGYQVDTERGNTWSMTHWFDGFSQMHCFQIICSPTSTSPTRVLYNSRTTVDKVIEYIRKTGSFDDFTFGQKRDPCESYFKKVASMFVPSRKPQLTDRNVGVTVSVNSPGYQAAAMPSAEEGKHHASGIQTLWAKTDAAFVKQIDPETLEPMGLAKQTTLHPDLVGSFSAAHSRADPLTGDIFNYNLQVGRKSTYRVFRVSASTEKTEILATITDAPGAYIHSLFLTKNHVVLCVWGSHYAYSGLKVLWEKNILEGIAALDPSKLARWYVIDQGGKGVVATYESEPFFCFHSINAWEEPSPSNSEETDIVAELCAYESNDVLKRFYYDNLKSTSPAARAYMGPEGDPTRASITRWRLPAFNNHATSGTTLRAHLDWAAPRSSSGELPTLNPNYITRSHRYVYCVTDRGKSTFFDGLVKFDTQKGEPLYWQVHGQSPGEAIFVPNPDGTEEDDGVLLTVVLDGFKGKSYLLCLDARSMTETGRASMESVVGYGFHGTYVQGQGRALEV